jgi:hypothetical protein
MPVGPDVARRFLVMALVALVPHPVAAAFSSEEPCPVCVTAGDPQVESVRKDLERALQIGMELPDCIGPDRLQACREMESALVSAFASLRKAVGEDPETSSGNAIGGGDSECLACDPRPAMALLSAVKALGKLLEGKQYEEIAPFLGSIEGAMSRWTRSRCCQTGAAPSEARERNREADARAILLQKCGPSFVDNRRGLRQVVRAPGERQGCFQSRACRQPTSTNGQLVEAGFWTYDGEYWYVWAERRTPKGDWVTCSP